MPDLSNSTIDAISDFLEIVAIATSPKPLSLAEAKNIAEQHANVSAIRVDRSFEKLLARKVRFGPKYPFLVTNEYISKPSNDGLQLYEVLLSLSAPGPIRHVSAWSIAKAAKIMERVVEGCFDSFFGENTRSVNFGFPSEIQRPSEFSEAVEWLSKKTGIPVGSGYRPARFKDGGVDIFIWKAFGDRKPGVPILLLQCTIQEKFVDKIGDVDRRLWASWLSSDIDPIVGLCVPHIVDSDEAWAEVTTRGLLFDRVRLVEMARATEVGLSSTEQAFLIQLFDQFRDSIS